MIKSKIIIYTDGSSRGNPGRGGWGVIVADEKRVVELGGHETMTTNNRMELKAAIKGLLRVNDFENKHVIDMRVDSQYVINGITKWVHGWQKNRWINSRKEAVLNRDLWEELVDALAIVTIQGSKVSWRYAPGHAGIPGNERADEIATEYADKKQPALFNGSREEYAIDLDQMCVSPTNKKQKKSSEKKIRQKAKAYSYLSLVQGKVMRHPSWTACEQRVRGVKGVKFKKAVSADDESAILREWKII
jgi:ribonuclease HI